MRAMAARGFGRVMARSASDHRALLHMREIREITKFFLSPDGTVGLLWTVAIVFFSVYNCLALPLRIGFMQNYPVTSVFALDYLGDAVFIIDIFLRTFVFGFYDLDDLVMVRAKITKKYLSGRSFWIHLASVVPLDFFMLAGPVGSLGGAQTLSLYRLNRMIRLVDLEVHIARLEKATLQLKAEFFGISRNALRIVKLILTVYITAHLSGCLFFLIAYQVHLSGDEGNWADKAGLLPSCRMRSMAHAHDDQFLSASDDQFLSASVGGTHAATTFDCFEIPSSEDIVSRYIHSVYWAVSYLTLLTRRKGG